MAGVLTQSIYIPSPTLTEKNLDDQTGKVFKNTFSNTEYLLNSVRTFTDFFFFFFFRFPSLRAATPELATI